MFSCTMIGLVYGALSVLNSWIVFNGVSTGSMETVVIGVGGLIFNFHLFCGSLAEKFYGELKKHRKS